MQVNVYEGPPFKFNKSLREHTKFANCARFSPDGALFCTVGSDMKIILWDAGTSEKKGNGADASSQFTCMRAACTRGSLC